MPTRGIIVALLFISTCCFLQEGAAPSPVSAADPPKVYGEWRIRVRPDRGAVYSQLIKEKGLPLFREAGGRMVGWWTTLIGDLYEHVTIWEYDGMPAFEKAVQFLGADERFAKFVSLRDPLLIGEESRFLRLASFAEKPALPQPGKLVIHETHRVPPAQMAAHLKLLAEAIPVLKEHKFRLVGPWATEVGKWSEVTLLFCFESLSERDRLNSAYLADPDGKRCSEKLLDLVDEVTTRLLVPAAFAQ
ncbi:MAG TPA: NIPSNAP family protein [Planctomycetota bacterium]|nr:NIPSNAP family protein [Planctomycetota bacterium]